MGVDKIAVKAKVQALFSRLHLSARLWSLSPTTFARDEKQRIDIGRALVIDYPILLLDKPTSTLDAANAEVVQPSIAERKAQECAIVGFFCDAECRVRVCDRELKFG